MSKTPSEIMETGVLYMDHRFDLHFRLRRVVHDL